MAHGREGTLLPIGVKLGSWNGRRALHPRCATDTLLPRTGEKMCAERPKPNGRQCAYLVRSNSRMTKRIRFVASHLTFSRCWTEDGQDGQDGRTGLSRSLGVVRLVS